MRSESSSPTRAMRKDRPKAGSRKDFMGVLMGFLWDFMGFFMGFYGDLIGFIMQDLLKKVGFYGIL